MPAFANVTTANTVEDWLDRTNEMLGRINQVAPSDSTLNANTIYANTSLVSYGRIDVELSQPEVDFIRSSAALNLKRFRIYSNSDGALRLGSVDDGYTTGQDAYIVGKANTQSITSHTFYVGAGTAALSISNTGVALIEGNLTLSDVNPSIKATGANVLKIISGEADLYLGNSVLEYATVVRGIASSVNYFDIIPAVTGSPITLKGNGDATAGVNLEANGAGTLKLGSAGNSIGFYGAAGAAKQTITGSRGGNAALASLLTALANYGLITDSSS